MSDEEKASVDTLLLVDLPPTERQIWWAVGVAVFVIVGFGGLVPFTGASLAELNAFFPSLDAIVFVTDLVTSVLLFAQFSVSRSRAVLLLATGYLFTALIVVPHALTFAGAFSPTGLLGAGIQTGSWLFIFWHIGFAAALLGYAVLRQDRRAASLPHMPVLPAIGLSVAIVFGAVCGLSWLATAGADLLPPIILDNRRISPLVHYPIALTLSISLAALAVLWFRLRSVLDLWLIVVALVASLEMVFSGLLPSVRFSLGFYAGRVLALMTSSIVLIILLAESTRLYVSLARSHQMLQRERNNKLMTLEAMAASIAHEVRQPLSGITTSGAATLRFLRRIPPDLVAAEAAVDRMIAGGHRASRIFDNVRSLFGKGELATDRVDVNRLALEVLRAQDADLKSHGIVTRIELTSELPPVVAHKGQLQEVMMNLVQNAVEAMDSVGDGRRILGIRTGLDADKAIVVTVEDTGPGLDPDKADGIFDAFVSTKPDGMGLGLAICQRIVERHGGQLSAAPVNPRGASFRIVLPRAGNGNDTFV
jgi:signal transduction histidine kinase